MLGSADALMIADDGDSVVATADAPPLTVYGTYDDRFVRTPEGWRIAARTDHPLLQVPGTPPTPA
mgnify:CR=1 FL=1